MSNVFDKMQKEFSIPKVRTRKAVMKIVNEVSRKSGVSKLQILSSSRSIEDVAARDKVIFKANKYLKISNSQLGRILGGRHYSTITHSLRRSKRAKNHTKCK